MVSTAFLFSLENWRQCLGHHHASLLPNDHIRLCRLKLFCTISFVSLSPSVIFLFVVVLLLWVVTVSGFFRLSTVSFTTKLLLLLLEAWHDWKLEEKPQLNSLALILTVISNHRLILLLDLTNGSQSAQLSSLENM